MTDFSIIFVVINSFVVIRMCKSKKLHILFKILLCVSFFGWNAAPALLMYIPNLIGSNAIVSDTYIKCSYYNQIYLFFAYLIGYYLIQNKNIPRIITQPSFQDDPKIINILLRVSILLSLYKLYITIISTSSYFENNDISNYSTLGPLAFLSGYAFSFLIGIVFFFRRKVNSTAYYISTSIVVLDFLIHTIRGGRIYIFGVVILLIYFSVSSSSRFVKKNLLTAGLIGSLALFLLPLLGSLRGDTQVKMKDVVEAASSDVGVNVIGEILTKTNSVMYGSYLIDKDGIGKWDGLMYSSTIYALVPRFIAPNKPEPGSVNGSLEGLPARASVIYSVVGDYNGIGNNGVPASISSLWGGGWIAYFVELIITALLLFLINGIFISKKVILGGFVFALISFPIGVLEIPLPTVLISIQRYAVVFLVLYLLLSPFCTKNNRL